MTTPDHGLRRLVVVGELNADVVVRLDAPPRFGQAEQLVRSTEVVLGSSSAITACGAARMSVPTSLVSVIGDDLLGRFLLEELEARGIDTSACRVDSELPTGASTILSLPDGNRAMLTALGTIGVVGVGDVPAGLLEQAGHVHVGSYFLQRGLQGDLSAFFAECRRAGLSTSLDPNDDPSGHWQSGLPDALGQVDVFFCNEAEALALAGTERIEEACDWLATRLPQGAELVVKHGPDGALGYVVGDSAIEASYEMKPEVPPRPLVDTVGAGDSLAAGYLAARIRGLTPEACLRVGVRNGTASTRATGGIAGQLTWGDAVGR